MLEFILVSVNFVISLFLIRLAIKKLNRSIKSKAIINKDNLKRFKKIQNIYLNLIVFLNCGALIINTYNESGILMYIVLTIDIISVIFMVAVEEANKIST